VRAGIYGGIFLFSFGFAVALYYWKKIKWRRFNRYTIFLLISLVMASLSMYASWDIFQSLSERIVGFCLSLGICFAVFTIFYKLDYAKIKHSFLHLMKNIAYGVIFPSMFLIIALMGNIDKTGQFMALAKPELIKAGVVMGNAAIRCVEQIYLLGRYKYSLQFIIAIFIFLVFYALADFFKEVRYTYREEGEIILEKSGVLKGGNESKNDRQNTRTSRKRRTIA
jgi:hypothetical protein